LQVPNLLPQLYIFTLQLFLLLQLLLLSLHYSLLPLQLLPLSLHHSLLLLQLLLLGHSNDTVSIWDPVA
jgi:hypothetical protein